MESVRKIISEFRRNESGATMVVFGVVIPIFVGAIGLATEISYWQFYHRAMQNAADAAAIAAATNNNDSYMAEAKGVAAKLNFVDGSRDVSVEVSSSDVAAGCTSRCFTVTIRDKVPLFLATVVGFQGNAAQGGKGAVSISATAVATVVNAYPYCLLALASSGAPGIVSNGAPYADLNGCNIMSNTSARCTGHDLNATYGEAHGSNVGCGISQNSNVPAVADPYQGLSSNIPADTCRGNYPQEPVKKNDPSLPSSNQWLGTVSTTGVRIVCGDQQLIGNTTINDTVLVIENGQLDTNGFTLTGTNLTIIFSGTNNPAFQHIPTGGGRLDIAAPTSGDWSGVAMMQDASLTKNVDVSAAGNSPTWNISGLVYFPHSSVTFSGAVSKSSNGAKCFVLVVDNISVNGTAGIFQGNNQCAAANLSQPGGGYRGTLVN